MQHCREEGGSRSSHPTPSCTSWRQPEPLHLTFSERFCCKIKISETRLATRGSLNRRRNPLHLPRYRRAAVNKRYKLTHPATIYEGKTSSGTTDFDHKDSVGKTPFHLRDPLTHKMRCNKTTEARSPHDCRRFFDEGMHFPFGSRTYTED